MFARENAQHHQIAYVTNDLDRAIALFKSEYAMPGFFVFNNVDTGAAKPGDAELRIALAHVNGVEIELIEPVGDTAPLFKAPLKAGPELEIRFHHVAIRINGPIENWDVHAASIDTVEHPIVYQGALGDDLRYFYTDERSRLGHYVEHVWMSPTVLEQIAAVRPKFPMGG
jgi:hypothetical protein